MIIYPLAYTFGVVFEKLTKHPPKAIDYYLTSLFTWFIVFMRAPYVPVALAPFLLILWGKSQKPHVKLSAFLFVAFSFITVVLHDIGEYFFNVVTFNYLVNLPSEIKADMFGNRFFQSFLYPLYVFFYGDWNIIKQTLVLVDIVFLVNIFYFLKIKHIN